MTEIVGLGKVDIGLKAMIHTIAARARGYPIISVGTLLDESPTGLIALKSSGIHSFSDIVGKRVGYIGEFGKLSLDQLAGLGCCCFCSLQFIVNEDIFREQPETIKKFMRATQRGAAFSKAS